MEEQMTNSLQNAELSYVEAKDDCCGHYDTS
jgi:hypothetical protein